MASQRRLSWPPLPLQVCIGDNAAANSTAAPEGTAPMPGGGMGAPTAMPTSGATSAAVSLATLLLAAAAQLLLA